MALLSSSMANTSVLHGGSPPGINLATHPSPGGYPRSCLAEALPDGASGVNRYREEFYYAGLAPEMVDLARQLAYEVRPGDNRLVFYVFRVLQRVAACTVEAQAMWKATWLRGERTGPKAIRAPPAVRGSWATF